MRSRPRANARAALICAAATLTAAGGAFAAIQGGGAAKTPQLIIGLDDDSTADPVIQPPGTGSDQSTRKADTIAGGQADDTLVGRLGPDVMIAGPGDDVMVGGTEAGSDTQAFPAFDQALGGTGDDVFVWAPGDGSDAYSGGEEGTEFIVRKVTSFRVVRRDGRNVRVRVTRNVRVRTPPDDDVLIFGTMTLKPGDNTQPELFTTRFGALPQVNVSGVGLPAQIGTPALSTVKGFCEFVPGSAVSNWNFFVRFRAQATGALLATIRTRTVERVFCRTKDQDTISEFRLGPLGAGPVVENAGFRPVPGSRLDLLMD